MRDYSTFQCKKRERRISQFKAPKRVALNREPCVRFIVGQQYEFE